MPQIKDATDRKIRQVGVIGAGLMGGGIGWWFINNKQYVRFKDVSWDMIRKSYQLAYKVVKKGVSRRKISKHQLPLLMDRMSGTLDYDGFGLMDMVVEAVPELMDLKKKTLKEIEACVSDDAIIATNTSSLSIDVMAKALDRPERFLGVHFLVQFKKCRLLK